MNNWKNPVGDYEISFDFNVSEETKELLTIWRKDFYK